MERKLTAIFSADVKGYSRLMGEDEEATIRTLTAYRELMAALIQQYRGRVVDSPGDNLLAEFASVVDAVRCAVEVQHELRVRNAELPDQRKMEFRIGINVGDVVVEGEKLYGDGVNIAARLEGLAEPGGICISGTVHDQIENKLALSYEYLGEQTVKNIAKPVRAWRVVMDEAAAALVTQSVLRQASPETHRVGTSHRILVTWPKGTLVLISVLLLVGIIISVQYLSFRPPAPSANIPPEQPSVLPLPDTPSIAVLPFTNMSGDPEQDYFSDGMTEDLITALSKLSGLFVIARHSAFVYKGKAVKIAEVSKELGVRYVLEGSVRKADSRVRINAQLVDATTDHHLWAEQYDRELKDIFALQDEIREKIVFALKVKLTPEERERFRYLPTASLEAYDALLHGAGYFFRFTRETNAQARQLYERALELDLQYAAAYAMLAWTYLADFIFQWNQDPQTLERAFETAQRAVALDDSLPVAHMTLGDVYRWRKQPEQALAEAERAIALDPNFAEGYAHLGDILNSTDRPAEAIKMVEKALRLSPHPPFYYLSSLAESHLRMGHYEEAIVAQKQVLLRNPNFLPAHVMLAGSYLAQWDSFQTQDPQTLERALESAQKVVALSDSLSWGHSLLARVYFFKKQHEQAIAEAERTIALVPNDAVSYAMLSYILSYAGQPEKAIEVMEQALRLDPRPPAWYLRHLGQAYRLTGRVEEASATLKRALAQDPDNGGIHLELAVLYSEVGREEEARAEVTELRRCLPKVSVAVLKQALPYKDPAEVERVLAALRQAGLK